MAEGGEVRSKTGHETPGQVSRKIKGYDATPAEVEKRRVRHLNRAHAIKDGRVAVGDKKELDHKVPLSRNGSNGPSNVRVTTQHANRVKGSKLPK
jgi:5-methylcytosine-specific restriction endonuclease McrA